MANYTREDLLNAIKVNDEVAVEMMLSNGEVTPTFNNQQPLREVLSSNKINKQIALLLLNDYRVDPFKIMYDIDERNVSAANILLNNENIKHYIPEEHKGIVRILNKNVVFDKLKNLNGDDAFTLFEDNFLSFTDKKHCVSLEDIERLYDLGHNNIVHSIVKNQNIAPKDRNSGLLFLTAQYGDNHLSKALLNHKFVKVQNEECSALHLAVENNNTEIVILLLADDRVDCNFKPSFGQHSYLPFDLAIREGKNEIINAFLNSQQVNANKLFNTQDFISNSDDLDTFKRLTQFSLNNLITCSNKLKNNKHSNNQFQLPEIVTDFLKAEINIQKSLEYSVLYSKNKFAAYLLEQPHIHPSFNDNRNILMALDNKNTSIALLILNHKEFDFKLRAEQVVEKILTLNDRQFPFNHFIPTLMKNTNFTEETNNRLSVLAMMNNNTEIVDILVAQNLHDFVNSYLVEDNNKTQLTDTSPEINQKQNIDNNIDNNIDVENKEALTKNRRLKYK